MRRLFVITAAVLAVSASGAALARGVIKTIPGPDGIWDYARVDPASHRLFVARGDSVTAIDLTGKSPAHAIGKIAHGHSVLPIPHSNTLLVTSGDDSTARFIDAGSGAETARVAVGKKPDAAILNAMGTTAFTMDAAAGTISRIDLATHKVTATITLKPGLEYNALTPAGMLFVNNEDENSLTPVDTRTNTALAPIALTGCTAPSGLAYDVRTDRLIVACDNSKAAIVNAGTKAVVGLLDIGEGPDAVILDAQRRKAYVPCGESGELDVIALDAKGGPAVTGRIKTEVGARTGAVDPTSGLVYLPTGKYGPPPAPGKRGAVVPGSFHVLVVQP